MDPDLQDERNAMYRLRTAALSWAPAKKEVIVLDLKTSMYLSSNESGKLLWELLAKSASKNDLARALVEHFAVDPARASVDADAFVADLVNRKLVERL